MPSFGRTSTNRLKTCDERLWGVCNAVIPFYDFSVLCGHRGKEEQRLAFATGTSQLQWPLSKHNYLPSKAIDLAPYPIDWSDLGRFYYLAGRIESAAATLGVPLRWGGQWDQEVPFNGTAAFYHSAGFFHQQAHTHIEDAALYFWKWSKAAQPDKGVFFDGPHFELVDD